MEGEWKLMAVANKYAICVNNEGVEVSLDVFRVYRMLPDAQAKLARMVRIVDNEGEDYLYPSDYFVPISVPKAAESAVANRKPAASRSRKTASRTQGS
jgi:hypothetical protein